MKKVLILAHRGDPGNAPENTVSSFRKAMETQADGLELDVQLTSDGYPVVVHDDALGRTCNGRGYVKDSSLAELRKLDFGSWFSEKYTGEKIPLLEEVLELTHEGKLLLNIEMKASPGKYNEGLENRLSEMIRAYDAEDRIIISSFNHYSLVKIKEINTDLRIAPLYVSGIVDAWDYAKKLGAYGVHPLFSSVTDSIVKKCKDEGLAVFVWTVDKAEDILRMAAAGVSAVITNKPAHALKILSSAENKSNVV